MADAGLDVLVLGRDGNIRFVSGATRLWLAGTRPFAPMAVVVGATGAVHLMSTTDAGIPSDVGRDRLYPMSWNPLTIAQRVVALPGVADASTVGVDGTTPMMGALLGGVLPRAHLVDGEAVMRAARRFKSDADLAGIRRAVGVAEECVAAVAAAVAPGVTERALWGRFAARMGELGVTTPAFDPTTCVAGVAPRAIATDRALRAGDLVHLRGGVLVEGWAGLVARSRVVGPPTGPQAAAADRARAALGDAIAACRPGEHIGGLPSRDAVLAVEGVGLGHEELTDDDAFRPGDVVSVEVLVDQVLLGDVVHVTASGPEILSTSPLDLT